MRSSWLYLAMRSVRESEPVLICPGVGGHGEVRDKRIFRLAGSVRDNSRAPVGLRQLNALECLSERPDLVDLYENRVGDAQFDAPFAGKPYW